MSDDLVKRLNIRRENMGIWVGSVLLDLYEKERKEAADRIEKLEALVERLRDDNSFLIDDNDKTFLHQESRIEKLEAALREIRCVTDDNRTVDMVDAVLGKDE